jgi:hypothetical protein
MWVSETQNLILISNPLRKFGKYLLEKVRDLGIFIHSTTFLKDEKHQNPPI